MRISFDEKAFVERFEHLLSLLDISIKDLSERTKIRYTTLHSIRSRGTIPGLKTIVQIADRLNLNLTWFILGEGPIFNNEKSAGMILMDNDEENKYTPMNYIPNKELLIAVQKAAKLPPNKQKALIKFIEGQIELLS